MNSSPIAPRMLTIRMVAEYLSATNWFVEELIRNRELPAQKFGKSYVVDLNDINEWVEKKKKAQHQADELKELLAKFRAITTDEEAQKFFDKIERGEELPHDGVSSSSCRSNSRAVVKRSSIHGYGRPHL